MKKKVWQGSAFLSVFWILLLLVTLTTATYAWFTISASTNVEPMNSAVSEGDASLQIASRKDGPFGEKCELILTGSPQYLSPVSTSDLNGFYEAVAQTREGISVLYRDVTKEADTKLLHGTVYLRSEYKACDVYLKRTGLDFGNTGQLLAALRLGMKITSQSGTETFIFRLDDMGNTGNAAAAVTTSEKGSVISSVNGNGKAVFVKDPAVDLADYLAVEQSEEDTKPGAGKKMLVHLNTDEVATVEFWLYMEGCDENCINAAQQKDTAISLAFAGVAKVDIQ